VVGYVALFVAMSGSAFAINGPLAGRNTVGSADIITGEVKSPDVANDNAGGALRGVDVSNANGGALTGKDVRESTLAGVNADKLDNIDSTGFLQNGDSAGGGLTGTYPNPTIGPDAVSGGQVSNDSLTGDDLSGVTALRVASIRCNDPDHGGGTGHTTTCVSGGIAGTPFAFAGICDNGTGDASGTSATVQLQDTTTGLWVVDSDGTDGIQDGVVSGGAPLIQVFDYGGPDYTAGPHFFSARYAAFSQTDDLGISGVVAAGVGVVGKDCVFDFSAFG
jgi:hypothetical protein